MDECEHCGKCLDIELQLWETGDGDGMAAWEAIIGVFDKRRKSEPATHRRKTATSVSLPSHSFATFIPITNLVILVPYLCHKFEFFYLIFFSSF